MANSATPELKEFARRLLDYEAAAGQTAGASGSAAFRVCEKLRGPLGKLVGIGGFRSLLSRALALAGEEVRWLRALHINADGALEGLDELETKLGEDEITLGEVVLGAQLLGLLETFIGPALTLGLIQDEWPQAALDDASFGIGDKP